MQIDTTTFVLELINFAVLVWILNRFLYRPVQAMMGRRREQIEQTLNDAAARKEDAENLREQYEARFKEWEREQNAARAALAKELAAMREKGLEEVRITLEKQKQRLEATSEKKQADLKRQLEKRALAQGTAFAAKFLERLAGPELDHKLCELFIWDFDNWPREKTRNLSESVLENAGKVFVTSAHALSAETRDSLQKTLSSKLDHSCNLEFSVDASLIAGIRIAIGPWILQADALDELDFFAGEIGRNA